MRKVRRFIIGFNLSYHLFLFFLVLAVPFLAGLACGFGALHRALNPQLTVADMGLWTVTAATGVTAILLGSRRQRLDAPLASVLPNASWRFYSQRGCSVFTYMIGRFFLTEAVKYIVIVLVAAGGYIGFVIYGADGIKIGVLAAIILCPLSVGLLKIGYDLIILLRRYRVGSPVLSRVFSGMLLVSLSLFVFYIVRSIVPDASKGSDLWGLVASQLGEDLPAVLLVTAVLFGVLMIIVLRAVRLLDKVRWSEVVKQRLGKTGVFKRLSQLSPGWFKAVITVDWRRTARSFYERMLPMRLDLIITLIILAAVGWWIVNGVFDVLSRDIFDLIVPYGLGLAQVGMLCGAVHSLFALDADRHAYMLWRTIDEGFKRILIVRSAVMSLTLYIAGLIVILLFCVVTGLGYLVTGVVISLGAATVLGTATMIIFSARWPHMEWREATDIERLSLPNFIINGIAGLLLYAVVFVFQNVRFVSWGQNIFLGLFLLALVPLASAGLSLAGYRLLRKGITAC